MTMHFGDLELEDLEPEQVSDDTEDVYVPASDEELADILEMNSENSIIDYQTKTH